MMGQIDLLKDLKSLKEVTKSNLGEGGLYFSKMKIGSQMSNNDISIEDKAKEYLPHNGLSNGFSSLDSLDNHSEMNMCLQTLSEFVKDSSVVTDNGDPLSRDMCKVHGGKDKLNGLEMEPTITSSQSSLKDKSTCVHEEVNGSNEKLANHETKESLYAHHKKLEHLQVNRVHMTNGGKEVSLILNGHVPALEAVRKLRNKEVEMHQLTEHKSSSTQNKRSHRRQASVVFLDKDKLSSIGTKPNTHVVSPNSKSTIPNGVNATRKMAGETVANGIGNNTLQTSQAVVPNSKIHKNGINHSKGPFKIKGRNAVKSNSMNHMKGPSSVTKEDTLKSNGGREFSI